MAEIIEVPINSEEIPEIPEIQETVTEPDPPAPKPKPKGRPKGAIGKKKEPVDEPQKKPKKTRPPPSECESEEEAPRRKKVQQPVYQPDNRAIAAEVLHMLSSRHLDRTAAKRDKYRSWFSNPY